MGTILEDVYLIRNSIKYFDIESKLNDIDKYIYYGIVEEELEASAEINYKKVSEDSKSNFIVMIKNKNSDAQYHPVYVPERIDILNPGYLSFIEYFKHNNGPIMSEKVPAGKSVKIELKGKDFDMSFPEDISLFILDDYGIAYAVRDTDSNDNISTNGSINKGIIDNIINEIRVNDNGEILITDKSYNTFTLVNKDNKTSNGDIYKDEDFMSYSNSNVKVEYKYDPSKLIESVESDDRYFSIRVDDDENLTSEIIYRVPYVKTYKSFYMNSNDFNLFRIDSVNKLYNIDKDIRIKSIETKYVSITDDQLKEFRNKFAGYLVKEG